MDAFVTIRLPALAAAAEADTDRKVPAQPVPVVTEPIRRSLDGIASLRETKKHLAPCFAALPFWFVEWPIASCEIHQKPTICCRMCFCSFTLRANSSIPRKAPPAPGSCR